MSIRTANAGATPAETDAFQSHLLRSGLLMGVPLPIVGMLIGFLLFELAGGTDRTVGSVWGAWGAGAGVLGLVAVMALRYRVGMGRQAKGRLVRLDDSGVEAQGCRVEFVDAQHLLAGLAWDENERAIGYDFRWCDAGGHELLRVAGFERATVVSGGNIVSADAVPPSGVVALLLDAEVRWASVHGVPERWQAMGDGSLRVDGEGIHDGETSVGWSAVRGAFVREGALHVEFAAGEREELVLSRTRVRDYRLLLALVAERTSLRTEFPVELRPHAAELAQAV
ncbi:MAG: hypothetical protein Q8P41_13080 [Pseudomonadota bacterium]|nr:hypothetical protein [Pseudomonadota bacterium]